MSLITDLLRSLGLQPQEPALDIDKPSLLFGPGPAGPGPVAGPLAQPKPKTVLPAPAKMPASVLDTPIGAFVAGFETRGGRPDLTAYGDLAGHGTFGYGHKLVKGDAQRYPHGVDADQARELFEQDMAKARGVVDRHVQRDLTPAQYDALTSMAYNLGDAAFVNPKGRPTRLADALNAGDFDAAANEMLSFNGYHDKNTHKWMESPGLTKRRRAEREIFLGGDYSGRP